MTAWLPQVSTEDGFVPISVWRPDISLETIHGGDLALQPAQIDGLSRPELCDSEPVGGSTAAEVREAVRAADDKFNMELSAPLRGGLVPLPVP